MLFGGWSRLGATRRLPEISGRTEPQKFPEDFLHSRRPTSRITGSRMRDIARLVEAFAEKVMRPKPTLENRFGALCVALTHLGADASLRPDCGGHSLALSNPFDEHTMIRLAAPGKLAEVQARLCRYRNCLHENGHGLDGRRFRPCRSGALRNRTGTPRGSGRDVGSSLPLRHLRSNRRPTPEFELSWG